MNIKVLCKDFCLEISGEKFRHHENGGGQAGEDTRVAPGAYVGINARVEGRAVVEEDALITDHAVVGEEAIIRKGVVVCGRSVIKGNAEIKRGYIDVSYTIATGVIDGGISLLSEKAQENVIAPVNEAINRYIEIEELINELIGSIGRD